MLNTGSAHMAGMTDPDRIWTEAAGRLRNEIGEGPFSSYIAPSAVRADGAGQLILVTPTAYARDWVRKNALRRMNELWLGLDGLSRRLEVRCRAEMGSTPSASQVAAGRAEGAAVIPFQPLAMPMATVPPVADGARAVRAAGLQERLTFDSFVEGQGNAFALAIARQAAAWADGHFNPIFFCGPYGYGKTHLLNAIAWEAQRLRPDARVVYLTAERFLSTFVRATQDRTMAAFKDSLRNADMLLIDDVQFVGGKAGTQEELLSTLTALIEDGKRIVLSADRPPMALTEVEPRLRSHLASGLTCPVEQADRALKLAVARNRIEALARLGVVSGEARAEVLEHLVDRTPGSMRELEGAVNTLAAVAGALLIPRIGASGFLASKLIYGLVPMLMYFVAARPQFVNPAPLIRLLLLSLALIPICWLPSSGIQPSPTEVGVVGVALAVLAFDGGSLLRSLRRR
jgi:chromosomal replication initiator protein